MDSSNPVTSQPSGAVESENKKISIIWTKIEGSDTDNVLPLFGDRCRDGRDKYIRQDDRNFLLPSWMVVSDRSKQKCGDIEEN